MTDEEERQIEAKCQEADALLSKLTDAEIDLIDCAVKAAVETGSSRPIVLDIPCDVIEDDLSLLYYPASQKIGNIVLQRLARLYRTACRHPTSTWGRSCHQTHSLIVETMAGDLESAPSARKFLKAQFGTDNIGRVKTLTEFHQTIAGTLPLDETTVERTRLSPFLYHQKCYLTTGLHLS